VHVWDVDKTYLDTHFSSLEGLLTIPIEFAVDKRAFAGMPEILRGLRWGGSAAYACVPILFVTASPPQLRAVLTRKMMLDGVEWDGIVFKDWLRVLRSLRVQRLREQLGFKLCALLTARHARPRSDEYLCGDDTEKDAHAFVLYARALDGSLSSAELESELRRHEVDARTRRCAHRLLAALPSEHGRVRRAYIHLAQHSSPAPIAAIGHEITPVRHAGELALALWQDEQLRPEATLRAFEAALVGSSSETRRAVVNEALERGLITPEKLAKIAPRLLPDRANSD